MEHVTQSNRNMLQLVQLKLHKIYAENTLLSNNMID